ncbi:MAG: SIS domain-containing protein [Methanomicrobiaceae archaeon]|nr:SIS domain-containing protein [Methanomicrobiaceae archaeon]
MSTRFRGEPSESLVKDMMLLMAENLTRITGSLASAGIEAFVSEILRARRVFTFGLGRSGLVASAFAMRLIHLGIPTFVVGESILPDIREYGLEGDVVVVFSRSGGPGIAADYAADAKNTGGARICLITGMANSPVGEIADCVMYFPCDLFLRRCAEEGCTLFAPLGTFFETAAWVFADAVVSQMMETRGTDADEMWDIHANLMGLFILPEKIALVPAPKKSARDP